jgi:hypothetical protein
MLELRPTCENCNTPLPPDSLEARICTYECTFCRTSVENVLENVCPNCGGGFVPRPIRPSQNWIGSSCPVCSRNQTHTPSQEVRTQKSSALSDDEEPVADA